MESTGHCVDYAEFERAMENFKREREEFEREKEEFERKKEALKRKRDASDCSSDEANYCSDGSTFVSRFVDPAGIVDVLKKKNAQGLAIDNHIKQLDKRSSTAEDVCKKITLAKDQYSSLLAEEIKDIINIRLEKLMELEIACVTLQCQALILQKVAGWDHFRNLKYTEVKGEMRNIQPSFNDARLREIFRESRLLMRDYINSERRSSGLISEHSKARILEWLTEEFQLLKEKIEESYIILFPGFE